MKYPPAVRCSPRHWWIIGHLIKSQTYFRLFVITAIEESSHSSGPFPISSCLFLERFQYWQEWGLPLPKVFVGSFRSHTETLPRRTPTAMKPRLCSTFSGEFFRRPTHINWSTYSLGTVVGQTTTVHFQTLPVRRRSFSQTEKTSYIRHTSLRYACASCCCRFIQPAIMATNIIQGLVFILSPV